MYLPQGSGELASGKISSSSSCEGDPISELVQGDVLLNVLGELNPTWTRTKRTIKIPEYRENEIKLQKLCKRTYHQARR